MKKFQLRLTVAVCCLTWTAAQAAPAQAQVAGRWELGNPSLHMDLPGQPARSGVAWAGQGAMSILPSSWRAEGGGLVVEVARFYGAPRSAGALLDSMEAALGAVGTRETGEVSGREFVLAQNNSRLAAAVAPSPGVGSSSGWGVVISYGNPGGAGAARTLWRSVVLDREGSSRTTMRNLGSSRLIAELPYDLTPRLNAADNQRRYEAHWDQMSVEFSSEKLSEGKDRFDTRTSADKYIQEMRSRPGVSNVKAERQGIKVEKLKGDMATVTLRRGTRNYKFWRIFLAGGPDGYQLSFTTDPERTDHILTVGRALETIRSTDAAVSQWKTHALGSMAVDAWAPFKAVKESSGLREWNSDAGLFNITAREVTLSAGTMMDPDQAVTQAIQIVKALPGGAALQQQGLEKRLVDGIPARLVRFTWRNAGQNNLRSILYVYGTTHIWVVDILAAPNYKDAHDRVLATARVGIPAGGARLQTVGGSRASFFFGNQPLEVKQLPGGVPEIKAIYQAIIPLAGGGVFAVVDQTMAEPGKLEERQALSFYDSFAKELNAPPPTETHPVFLDGARGFHFRGKATVKGATRDTDCLMLVRGKDMLSVFFLTDPNSPDRAQKDLVLNSLRLGSL